MLVGQLWYLQVLEGTKFRDMSEKNRIRVRPVAAPRGILFDRNGLALVDNRPAFTLSLIPREMEDRNTVLARLAVMLKIPLAELQDALAKVPAESLRPVRIRRGLSLEDVAKVEESKLDLPGVVVEVEPQRAYPTNTFAAHVLGYVREVSEDQMKQGRYRRGDMIGQTGLERLLDEHLRGRDGGERIEVDALRALRAADAARGASAGRAGRHHGGPPHPGGGGARDDRPRGLGGGHGPEERRHPRADLESRLRPRHLRRQHRSGRLGAAGEGSLASAAQPRAAGPVPAGLGVQVDRDGGGPAGRHPHADGPDRTATASTPPARGPGRTGSRAVTATWTCARAMVQSCDVFFYQYGLKVGPEAIARYARAFGLGSVTGVDLPGEKSGLVPSPEGRRERGRPWHSGDTLNIVHRPGRAAGDADPGRAHDGGHRQRRRAVETTAHSDESSVPTASSPTPSRAG